MKNNGLVVAIFSAFVLSHLLHLHLLNEHPELLILPLSLRLLLLLLEVVTLQLSVYFFEFLETMASTRASGVKGARSNDFDLVVNNFLAVVVIFQTKVRVALGH